MGNESQTKKLVQFYDKFLTWNKTQLESNVFGHLVKRCDFKIGEHRVKLKEKIDDIVLDMMNETNKYESMYLNNLQSKKHFEPLSFDDTK